MTGKLNKAPGAAQKQTKKQKKKKKKKPSIVARTDSCSLPQA
jgi:hypothetical protein